MNGETLLLHDVSGTHFVPGVTWFTVDHVLAACRLAGINTDNERDPIEILFHPALYSRQKKNGLVDLDYLDRETIEGMFVKSDATAGKKGNVFDTLVQQGDRKIILRTREA